MKDCPAAQEGRGFWSRDTEKTHCRLLISSSGTPDLIAEREFPGFSLYAGKNCSGLCPRVIILRIIGRNHPR